VGRPGHCLHFPRTPPPRLLCKHGDSGPGGDGNRDNLAGPVMMPLRARSGTSLARFSAGFYQRDTEGVRTELVCSPPLFSFYTSLGGAEGPAGVGLDWPSLGR
jgi:hypothetical protein